MINSPELYPTSSHLSGWTTVTPVRFWIAGIESIEEHAESCEQEVDNEGDPTKPFLPGQHIHIL